MIINKDLILEYTYPIGSIYITTNSINPTTLFGGEWERIQGRFLLGSGTPSQNNSDSFGTLNSDALGLNFSVGNTSGEFWHILNQQQVPSTVPVIKQISSGQWSLGHWNLNEQAFGTYGEVLPGQNGTGSQGQGHNNMPPYFVVNIWRRIK